MKKSKKGPVSLIVVGSLLALGPVWGLIGTVIGVVHAFFAIGQPGSGPEQLARNINLSLGATVAGLVALPIGVALLVGGIIWLSRIRKPAGCP